MLALLFAILFPYLQNPQPTQITVMWPSTNPQQTGWVEYGQDSLEYMARENVNGMWAAYQDINRVTLTNLQPATTYRYRVAALDIVGPVYSARLTYGDTTYSEVYEFTTPPAQPKQVSCLIFNDIHSGDSLLEPLLSNPSLDRWQQDFYFFNGDMMQAIASRDLLLTRMLNPCSQLFAHQIPWLCTRGNHEYRNKFTRELADYVTTPGTAQGHPFYYSFTWGPCFFIVLDSGLDAADSCRYYSGLSNTEAYRAEQQPWLEQQLKSKACRKAAFRVVLMHAPMTYYLSDCSMKDACRLFLDLCNRYQVDVAISGHIHRAGILPADHDRHFPIVVGGGKKCLDADSTRLPTIIQLQATSQQLQIDIWNYHHHPVESLSIPSKKR